jgi:transcriptional regulator with XRE-family HTH domain
MLDRDRLRMARLGLRLTQERLGKEIGQDQSYISRLERGDFSQITIVTLERLADALGVTTDFLLGRREKRGKKSAALALVEETELFPAAVAEIGV